MSAILQCLQPPPARRVEPTREHIGWDPVEVKPRPQAVPARDDAMKLTYLGETLTVAEWAARRGLTRQALYKRLDRGWSVDRALEVSVRSDRRTRGR